MTDRQHERAHCGSHRRSDAAHRFGKGLIAGYRGWRRVDATITLPLATVTLPSIIPDYPRFP